jgi:hypothetical protein
MLSKKPFVLIMKKSNNTMIGKKSTNQVHKSPLEHMTKKETSKKSPMEKY